MNFTFLSNELYNRQKEKKKIKPRKKMGGKFQHHKVYHIHSKIISRQIKVNFEKQYVNIYCAQGAINVSTQSAIWLQGKTHVRDYKIILNDLFLFLIDFIHRFS
jgi:hypothetical protein